MNMETHQTDMGMNHQERIRNNIQLDSQMKFGFGFYLFQVINWVLKSFQKQKKSLRS